MKLETKEQYSAQFFTVLYIATSKGVDPKKCQDMLASVDVCEGCICDPAEIDISDEWHKDDPDVIMVRELLMDVSFSHYLNGKKMDELAAELLRKETER